MTTYTENCRETFNRIGKLAREILIAHKDYNEFTHKRPHELDTTLKKLATLIRLFLDYDNLLVAVDSAKLFEDELPGERSYEDTDWDYVEVAEAATTIRTECWRLLGIDLPSDPVHCSAGYDAMPRIYPDGDVNFYAYQNALKYRGERFQEALRALQGNSGLTGESVDAPRSSKRHPLQDKLKLGPKRRLSERAINLLFEKPEWRVQGKELQESGVSQAQCENEAVQSAFNQILRHYPEARGYVHKRLGNPKKQTPAELYLTEAKASTRTDGRSKRTANRPATATRTR